MAARLLFCLVCLLVACGGAATTTSTIGPTVAPSPTASALPSATSSAKVSHAIEPKEIQRVVRSIFPAFRVCYEQGLRRHPGLTGVVIVRFVIGPDGEIGMPERSSKTDMPDDQLVDCTVNAFRGLRFPAPEGGSATVDYPVSFAPGN